MSEEIYRKRAAHHTSEQQRYERQSRAMSYSRVATFVAAVICAIVPSLSTRVPAAPLYMGAAALLLVFFVLVGLHTAIEDRLRKHRALAEINVLAIAKLHRASESIPVPDVAAPASHPHAEDLDLFGRASLFALLWNGGTGMARERLASWLLQPAGPEEIRARQEAIEELAPLVDLRQQLIATAVTGVFESHDVARFLEWVEGRRWLSSHIAAVWAVRALTASILLLVVLQATGLVAEAYWLAPVAVAFVVSNVFAKKTAEVFDKAFAHHRVFCHYAELFGRVSSADLRTPALRQLQAAVKSDGGAEPMMHRLDRLMQFGDLRHSALMHFPVQIFTLWDFHVIFAVEKWQRQAARDARSWFEAMATFEALESLAALRFDNPEWATPTVEDRGDTFEAANIGHPLLPPDHRVDNDVKVGPPGTFLLVTGSNMSGKSTLLRAIGVNVVLAQAGGPVCATRLRMPPVRLHTSMRVQDSLEHGVSFFMAAVQRLKTVVEAAHRAADAGQGFLANPLLMYLLDEVLQGTNTAERQIAVRSILKHLLSRPAIGAVTTHDLTLAETPQLTAAANAVHFTEQIDDAHGAASMRFDYRLRPGLATSHNALRLMQMVGLEVE